MSGAASAVPRVFVSHSHADNAFGVQLVSDLRAALGGDETTVWYDVAGGLHAGEAWWEKIVAEITARPVFVVILSPDAMASTWVNQEITMAWQLTNAHPERLIIPVHYRDGPVRADVNMLQRVSFLTPHPYAEALRELVARVRQHAPNALPAAPAPSRHQAADPAAALVAQLLPQIEMAARDHDWQAAVDKANYLQRHGGAAVPPALYRTLGNALVQVGDVQRAREAWDAALALDQSDIPTLLAAAHLRRLSGQDAEALPLLRDALALAPISDREQRIDLLAEYTDALAAVQQWDELARRADEGLRLQPNDPFLLTHKLTALAGLGRRQEALDIAHQLTARPDASAANWVARARLEHDLGQDAAAQASLASAQRLAPDDADVARAQHDLFPPVAVPERLASLGFRGVTTGKTQYILPPTRLIPAGEFLMGSDKRRDSQASDDELPQQRLTLPAYQIATFPITVAEYAYFVRAGQRKPDNWQQQQAQPDIPAVYVSWYDAMAYAAWLAQLTGQPWALPTEAEWEKAARGCDGRIYPWGDTFDQAKCNTYESGIRATTPVGSYPNGASPCGAQDMAGNVWEWTSSLFMLYPYSLDDGREGLNSAGNRALRGSSWNSNSRSARVAFRSVLSPDNVLDLYGFRVVLRA